MFKKQNLILSLLSLLFTFQIVTQVQGAVIEGFPDNYTINFEAGYFLTEFTGGESSEPLFGMSFYHPNIIRETDYGIDYNWRIQFSGEELEKTSLSPENSSSFLDSTKAISISFDLFLWRNMAEITFSDTLNPLPVKWRTGIILKSQVRMDTETIEKEALSSVSGGIRSAINPNFYVDLLVGYDEGLPGERYKIESTFPFLNSKQINYKLYGRGTANLNPRQEDIFSLGLFLIIPF